MCPADLAVIRLTANAVAVSVEMCAIAGLTAAHGRCAGGARCIAISIRA